jgi:hypothetical protein
LIASGEEDAAFVRNPPALRSPFITARHHRNQGTHAPALGRCLSLGRISYTATGVDRRVDLGLQGVVGAAAVANVLGAWGGLIAARKPLLELENTLRRTAKYCRLGSKR